MHESIPTLIVSCTDRKSLSPAPDLKLRSIPSETGIHEAVKMWAKRINVAFSEGDTLKLRDLYQGEYWSIARKLEHQSQVLVMSAGLGLQTLDGRGPGYAATFTKSSSDSVLKFSSGNPEVTRTKWWKSLLEEGLGADHLAITSSQIVVVAVSESYQQAVASQLIDLSKNGKLIFTISGSPQLEILKDIEGVHHVKVGQWLRMVLGGSTPSIGIRFAAKMLETGNYASPEHVNQLISVLSDEYHSERTEKLPVFDRKQLSDSNLRNWIEFQVRKTQGTHSKSALLRILRESGYACEQSRFGNLFDEVTGK